MDLIYVQSKRWTDTTVGRPDIEAFVGALEVLVTSKDVFITTARFSKEATSYVERLRQRVVLIDGEQLADLMIEHGVGVTTARSYQMKRIDETTSTPPISDRDKDSPLRSCRQFRASHRSVASPSQPRGAAPARRGPPIAWFKDPAGNILSVIQE
jgi:Restriction endonuclease